jgi:GNAT superfamily N-acetyltransferase
MRIIESHLPEPLGDGAAWMDIAKLDPGDARPLAGQITRTTAAAWEHHANTYDAVDIAAAGLLPTEAQQAKRFADLNRHHHQWTANIVAPDQAALLVAGTVRIDEERTRPFGARLPHVKDLAVHPEYQHKGISATLLDIALRPYGDSDPVIADVYEENLTVMGLAEAISFLPQRLVRVDRMAYSGEKLHLVRLEAPRTDGVRAILADIRAHKEQQRYYERQARNLRRLDQA